MHTPNPSAHACTSQPQGTPTLHPGERYAGPVLDDAGNVKHHLILLPARPDGDANWQAARAWAASVGGDLPDPQEQALLFANCRDALPRAWCWSNKEYEGDASYAWGCHFYGGDQGYGRKSVERSAVAVRRSILESFDSSEAATGATSAHAIVNFGAFAGTYPPDPSPFVNDAAYYHACALKAIANLHAAYTLSAQIWAVLGVPKALGAVLVASECLIEHEAKEYVRKHEAAGGADAPSLLAALAQTKKEGGAA